MTLVTTPAAPGPRHPVPTGGDLNAMIQVSQMLAKSTLVPAAYRGKPENVLLATLAGQPFGWDPTMAMRSFHIIEGTPSLKPEIMLALVRQAGHSVTGSTGITGATVTGTRRDTGDTMTFTFGPEDAKRAGLTGGKNYQKYAQSMYWARALSQLCRMLFPDVVLGAGYTPEELGAPSNNRTATHEVPAHLLSVGEAKRQLLDACDGDKSLALSVWTDAHMEGETAIDPVALDDLIAIAIERRDDAVVDAEVVDETTTSASALDLGADWSETGPAEEAA